MSDYGTIIGPNGFRYTFTDEDHLWACRMLVGEAGALSWQTKEGEAILWTLAQRWAGIYPRIAWSFTGFIRMFSQPINPSWYAGGQFDPDSGIYDDNEARRSRISGLALSEISPMIRELVTRFMEGKIANRYVGLVDFAGPGVRGANDIGPFAVPGVGPTSNWFYKEQKSLTFTNKTVTITNPSFRRASIGILAGIVLGSAIIKWR